MDRPLHTWNKKIVSGVDSSWWKPSKTTKNSTMLRKVKPLTATIKWHYWIDWAQKSRKNGFRYKRKECYSTKTMHCATSLHGKKLVGSVCPTRRTHALNTRRAARPLFSRTALPICRNPYLKLGEPLREILDQQALSSVWGNQFPNFRVDVTLNQRGAAFPLLVQWFY